MKQKSPCPRCGVALYNAQMGQHREWCDRMPLPAEMYAEFMESGLSIHQYAIQCHGMSSGGAIRRRMALVPGVTEDALAAIGKSITAQAAREAHSCERCGRRIADRGLARHLECCEKHPRRGELVRLWKQSGLRVSAFCDAYGYEFNHVSGVFGAMGISRLKQQEGMTMNDIDRDCGPLCKKCKLPVGRLKAWEGICQFCIQDGARRYGMPVPAAAW
jgi:hypothetical protein